MSETFVSEEIHPAPGTADARSMAAGEPGLPRRFTWRGNEYSVADVLETWKTTGPCKSGSDERYVRKHWFRLRTATGEEMKIYFERQPRSGCHRKARWWLYTINTENAFTTSKQTQMNADRGQRPTQIGADGRRSDILI